MTTEPKLKYSWYQDGEGYYCVTGPNVPDAMYFGGEQRAQAVVDFLNKLDPA